MEFIINIQQSMTLFLVAILILTNLTFSYQINDDLQYQALASPFYDVYKLLYTNLSKTQSLYLQRCIQRTDIENNLKYQLIGSVNIYDGEAFSYPAIVRYCSQYYTLNGHLIYRFGQNKHFISSMRNEATYFAQITEENSQFCIVTIRKLVSRNKKVILEEEAIVNVSKQFGEITSFSNSFSLSLKLFSFATNSRFVLFYRMDGKLESSLSLGFQGTHKKYHQKQGLYLIKLSLQLAIFTNTYNGDSILYTISTNGKNSTLKKYNLPKLEQIENGGRMEVKYRDQNWNQLYLRIGSNTYMYNLAKGQNNPKASYKLLSPQDQFYVTNSMIIIEPARQRAKKFRIYYNLTDGIGYNFLFPDSQHLEEDYIQACSQSASSQMLCVFYKYSFECYSLSAASDQSKSSKLDYTDYSKLRVPLVIISLGVVIFISVSRSRKGKSIEDEKEEQVFMKQLEKRDKSLYQELKRNKVINNSNPTKLRQFTKKQGLGSH